MRTAIALVVGLGMLLAGCASSEPDKYLGTGTHIASDAVVSPASSPATTPPAASETPETPPQSESADSIPSDVVAAAKSDLATVQSMREDFSSGLKEANELLDVRDVDGAVTAVKSGVSAAVMDYQQLNIATCAQERLAFPKGYPAACGFLDAALTSQRKCVDRFSRGMLSGNYELAKLGLLDCDKVVKGYDAAIEELTRYIAQG